MTDPTTQATRVVDAGLGWSSLEVRVEDGRHRLIDISYVGRWQAGVLIPLNRAADLCATVDAMSGEQYRARIERETRIRTLSSIKQQMESHISEWVRDEDGPLDDPVRNQAHEAGMRFSVEVIDMFLNHDRAQQPSDQTQGVNGES